MAFDEATRTIIEAAEATIKDAKEAARKKGPKEDPLSSENLHRIVEWLYETHFAHNEEPTLRLWNNNWWRWRKGTWTMISKEDLDAEIFGRVIASKEDGGFGLKNFPHFARLDTLALLRDHLLPLPDSQEFQSWLPASSEVGADIKTEGTWVNCTRGPLRAADTEDPEFIPHTPRYFTPVLIPRKYVPEHPPTFWLNFLDQVLERDEKRIAVLQEWFGYCLLPTTRYQRMLMLVGPGGNGKTVVLNVLTEMLGKHNCSNVELDDINTKYGPFYTFGKLANICGDIATRYLKKPGRIKAFIGGDMIQFEQKYMNAFSTKPTAKLIFSMNDLPNTDDDSEGFYRRMLTIPFMFTPPEPDPLLANSQSHKWPFRPELDGIFTWALEGLIHLLHKDGFTESNSIKECMDAWRLGNEGVRRYADERLDFNHANDVSTPCDFISLDYEKWAKKNREKPFSAQGLGKRLRRIHPKLDVIRRKTGTKVVRHWHGLQFRADAPVLGD